MIFVNQKIGLSVAFTVDGTAQDISGGTVVFEYYYPGNTTSIKDGEINGTITDATAGEAEATFPATLNTTSGKYLRVQAALTLLGETYLASATCIEIYPIGAGC